MATTRQIAIKNGYRSGLEEKISEQLKKSGVRYGYESMKIEYHVSEDRRYTPDFILYNGIIVETKGRFTVQDRKKHLLIKEQHKDLDIRFVFSNSCAKISKTSKTSYADWCSKYGFIYADKQIPNEWLIERGSKDENV